MSIDLPHLAARVFGTPLLLHKGKLDTILSAVGPRILEGHAIEKAPEVDAMRGARRERSALMGAGPRYFSAGGYLADDGIAVLPVHGTLIRRGSWLDSMSGMTSYGSLMEGATEILTSPDVRGLMLELDTPGGEAGGVFDLTEFLLMASESTGKPIWAHANELAASAGYAIATAASRIWVPTTGEVGSIGVVAAHIDQSAFDAKLGVKWTYIFSGENKVDGNPHEPLSDTARASIEADVEDLYGMFVDLVAQNRAIDAADIRATQANIYRGTRAIDSGLADEIGTFDEAMTAFAAHVDELQTATGSVASAASIRRSLMGVNKTGGKPGATEQVAEEPAAPVEPAPAAPAAPNEPAQPAPVEPAKPDEAAAAAAAERKRCAELSSIGTQAARMGVTFDVGAAIDKGTSAAAARESVMNAAAEKDAAATTTQIAPGHRAEKSSPASTKAAWSKAMKKRR